MKPSNRTYLDLLTHYLKPHWPQATWLGILLLANTGLQFVNPLILGYFIDRATGGAAMSALFWIAMLFLGLAFVTQVVSVVEVYVAENLGLLATNRLRADV